MLKYISVAYLRERKLFPGFMRFPERLRKHMVIAFTETGRNIKSREEDAEGKILNHRFL
ncbi:MAG: hypothetical protein FWF54_01245 [Candidatus Azobacteroides sp.]|nr:hypothetical protein [Candidatus Azobacteroides sp.]